MTDIAELGIRIDARQVRQGGAALDDFANRGARAERATVSMEGAVKSLGKGLAALALVAKAIDFGSALIGAQRQFDKINASLVTATGSVGSASKAFAALQSFAAKTPYSINEVSEAFIKLRNLGLTPSERALTSYGNTASAMGKSLNQMIEAVADAATGEFERLKEFGIKSKQQGDTVSFTFQGVTTSVANNAAAIESYLMRLGETKFAGGMERQANSLDGAISNLGDAWNTTLLTFSQSGFGDVAMGAILALSGALGDLQAIIKAVTGEADAEKKKMEELGPVHAALTGMFKAVAVVGANVAYVFRAIGKDMGAFAAAVVAAASGDFKLAAEIARQRRQDSATERQEIDARTDAILTASATTKKATLEDYAVKSQAVKQISAAQKKAAEDAVSWAKKAAEAGALELSIMRAEQNAMGDLTDAQKNSIKVRAEMAKYGDLIPAKLKKVISSHLDEAEALERVNLERAQYIALMSDAANAAGADIAAANDATKSLQEQVKYYGQTEVAVLRLKSAEYDRQLAAASNNAIEVNRLFQLKAATEDQIALQEQLTRMKADTSFWQSLEETAHQTFVSILDGGKDLGTRLKDTLKNTFFDWLYQMTLKKWIISIGAETSGLSTIAGQAGSGGGVGSLLSNITSLMGNGSGSLSSILTNGIQSGFDKLGLSMGTGAPGSLAHWGGAAGSTLAGYGMGSAANSAISGKYSVGGSGVQKAITVAASAYFGPIGGAVAGAILGAVNRAFGRGPKETTSQGLQGTFGADSFSGSNYSEWVKKGGWFRSDKRGTDTTALSDEQGASLNTAYKAIKDSTSAFAVALGLPTNLIDSYTKTIKLVSTGDAAKDRAALAQLFADMGDELAGRVLPNVAEFIRQGETAAGALERLSAEFQTVDVVLKAMGVTSQQAFGAVGVASLAARDRLVLAAGGLEAFAAQSDYFMQNFLTEAERMAPVQKAVAEQMAAMGYASVTTNEQFKDVVMGLTQSGALATEAGAKLYAGLLAIAPQFKAVADYAKQVADADAAGALQKLSAAAGMLSDGVDTALAAVSRSVKAQRDTVTAAYEDVLKSLETSIDSVSASIAKTTALSDLLKGTLNGMSMQGQEAANRAAAQAQIQAALAIAKAGGPLPDADSLRDALTAASKSSMSDFGSMLDYQRDFVRTAASISELSTLTGTQLTAEQRQLALLQDQRDLAQKQYDAEMERLDGILENAQTQVDVLNGVAAGVQAIPAALAGLAAAIAAATKNPLAAAPSVTQSAYSQYLGRDASKSEIDYWTGQAGAGVNVGNAIAGSDEAYIQSLYKELLGRTGEAAGVDSWEEALRGGQTRESIRAGFMASEEYKKLHPKGFATGGLHDGGWRIVGENGPELENTGPSRVYSNSASSELFRGLEKRLESLEMVMATGLSRLISESKRGSDAMENVDKKGVATRDEKEIA